MLFRKYPEYSSVFGDDVKTNLIYSGRVIAPHIDQLIPKYYFLVKGRLLFSCSPELSDLLRKLFQYDPKKRITAEEACRHPFFAGVNLNSIKEYSYS